MSYGFRTHPEDRFLRRVAKEAKATDSFLLTVAKDMKGSSTVTALVRAESLPPASAHLTLLKQPLSKSSGRGQKIPGFRVISATVDDSRTAKRLANTVRGEIQRLKNFNTGKTVAVQVEAL